MRCRRGHIHRRPGSARGERRELSSFTSAWAIARWYTFPATTKVWRPLSAWAEISRAGHWTIKFISRDSGRGVCHLAAKVIGRLAPGDINTEVRGDARFDGRAIAPPGVRARNASQATHRIALVETRLPNKMQQSMTHLFESRRSARAQSNELETLGDAVAKTRSVKRGIL